MTGDRSEFLQAEARRSSLRETMSVLDVRSAGYLGICRQQTWVPKLRDENIGTAITNMYHHVPLPRSWKAVVCKEVEAK